MSQSQFDFDIDQSFDLKNVISKCEVNPFVNNKEIAS
jgi:hypothetical protein